MLVLGSCIWISWSFFSRLNAIININIPAVVFYLQLLYHTLFLEICLQENPFMFLWLCSSNVASWVTPGPFSSSWITPYPAIFRPLTAANFKCCASEWLNMAGLELRMPSQRLSDIGILCFSFSGAVLSARHSKSFWNKKHSGNEDISKFSTRAPPQSKPIRTFIYTHTNRVTIVSPPKIQGSGEVNRPHQSSPLRIAIRVPQRFLEIYGKCIAVPLWDSQRSWVFGEFGGEFGGCFVFFPQVFFTLFFGGGERGWLRSLKRKLGWKLGFGQRVGNLGALVRWEVGWYKVGSLPIINGVMRPL